MKLSLGINGMPEYTGALRGDASLWKKRTVSDKDAHRLLLHRIQGPDTDTSNGRLAFARQWHLNYAFTFGHQSFRHAYAGLMRDFERHLPPEPTYTTNRILPKVQRQVSKLTSAPIDWRVPPRTLSIEDQDAARVGQKVLTSLHHELGVENVRKEAVLWSVINGNGFIRVGYKPHARLKAKVYKDPVSGKKIPADQLSEAARNRLAGANMEEDEFEGMPFVEALGPSQVIVPILPTGMLLETAPWLITSTRMHVSEAANRFGRDIIDKLEPDLHSERLWDFYQRSIKTMVLFGGGGISHLNDREQEELVTIHEMWEPPSAIKPDGLHVVATRNEWLVVEKYQRGARRFPVAKIDYYSMPGRFWSKGMTEELIMAQRSKNLGRSDGEMIRDRLARPKVALMSNAGVTSEQWTSDMAVLTYKKGFNAPAYISASGAGDHQTLQIVDQQIDADMDASSFQGPISQGQGAPGVRSAEQGDQLLEQDAQALGSPVTSQELALRDVGSMILFEVQQHFTTPRLITIYGDDRQSDVMSFTADMLRGHTEVHVQEGSLLPRSPAVERKRLMEASELGYINPQDPRALRLWIKTARVQNADSLLADFALHERRADQENQMFGSDDPSVGMPIVEEFDNHQAHIDKHLEFLLSDRYEVMTKEAPVLARTAVAHYQRHIQFQQQQMMAQLQMQMALKGGPGEKGTPSQPAQNQSAERGGGRAA